MAGSQTIPKWLKKHLDLDGAQKIEQAVARAELTTEAEIVPMIVRSSSSRNHAFYALLASLLIALFILRPDFEANFPAKYLIFFEALLLIASLALAAILSRAHSVQRRSIPRSDQIANVEHRAVYEYHHKKIGRTRNDSGVLIFVSLVEHRAVILAEGEILDKIENELWQKAIDELLFHTRYGRLAQGFEEAIKICTQRLSEVAPAKPDNPNQISNHLVIEE